MGYLCPQGWAGAPDKASRLRYLAPMQPITTTAKLADACARMARHPFVTVDTEFLRESTYYPRLCVAQMASTDEAVVIDALAAGIDLAPFFALMADENVVKVFHAARQDIEICWHEAGIIPQPPHRYPGRGHGTGLWRFHLLRPARAANHRRQSRQVAPFHRLDAAAAERARSSPTPISDVTHLRDVYLKLSADLDNAAAATGCARR